MLARACERICVTTMEEAGFDAAEPAEMRAAA